MRKLKFRCDTAHVVGEKVREHTSGKSDHEYRDQSLTTSLHNHDTLYVSYSMSFFDTENGDCCSLSFGMVLQASRLLKRSQYSEVLVHTSSSDKERRTSIICDFLLKQEHMPTWYMCRSFGTDRTYCRVGLSQQCLHIKSCNCCLLFTFFTAGS